MSKLFRCDQDNVVTGDIYFEGVAVFRGPVSIDLLHPRYLTNPDAVALTAKPLFLIPVYDGGERIGYIPIFGEIEDSCINTMANPVN